MFQWICPECGQEIDPRVQECSACKETPVEAAPAQEPTDPPPASRLFFSPIDPKPTFPGEESPSLDVLWSGPLQTDAQTAFPDQSAFPASMSELAPPIDYTAWVRERTQPAVGRIRSALAPSNEALTLFPPTLPGKPAPPSARNIDLPPAPPPVVLARPERSSNWIVSTAVAVGMLGFMAVAAIYAMPTLARSNAAKPEPELKSAPQLADVELPMKPAEDPLAATLEIAGVRFVTNIPGRRPEIHYLVVNHSGSPVPETTVTVMLSSEEDGSPLSQFAFRTPRLDAYESKEMVNSIDPLKQAAPKDWRHTRVDISLKR